MKASEPGKSGIAPRQLSLEPLAAQHFQRAAEALGHPEINAWMYVEWRENVVTERTIAAAVLNKRNRLWLVSVDGAAYGLTALGSITNGDQTAAIWYLRFPGTERLPGVMQSAVTWVIRHAFDELGLNSLTASVHADNLSSIGLLEGAGFRRAGVLRQGFSRDGRFVDRVVYDLLRHEAGA